MSSSCWANQCSSSSSSSGEDDVLFDQSMTPTQLLSVAIKKRRAMVGQKERDLRLELLHTGMIQTLCKHLGERRARRRRRGSKRTKGHMSFNPESPVQALSEQEPPMKTLRLDNDDPFGLDDVFRRFYGYVPSQGNRSLSGEVGRSSLHHQCEDL